MNRWTMILAACAIAMPASARAQGSAQVQGFGGMTFGDVTTATTFGGNVTIPLSQNVHAIVQGGRLTDVMPSTIGTLLDLTPIDVRLSAWYGEGGVRFLSGSSHVRPYAQATAGFARLKTGFVGGGSTVNGLVNTALRLLDRTEPMLGVGGGVVVQGGPVFVDLGYHYRRIMAEDSVQAFLSGGHFSVSEVRVGVGVGF